jgi:hypothetical protein
MKQGRKPHEDPQVPREVGEDAAGTIARERTQIHWMNQAFQEFEQNGGARELPGFGKPLEVSSTDPLNSILKNANYTPPWIELQKEIRQMLIHLLQELEGLSKELAELRLIAINEKITKYNNQVPIYTLQKMPISLDMIQSQVMKWM